MVSCGEKRAGGGGTTTRTSKCSRFDRDDLDGHFSHRNPLFVLSLSLSYLHYYRYLYVGIVLDGQQQPWLPHYFPPSQVAYTSRGHTRPSPALLQLPHLMPFHPWAIPPHPPQRNLKGPERRKTLQRTHLPHPSTQTPRRVNTLAAVIPYCLHIQVC
jgi:hypothetical protein